MVDRRQSQIPKPGKHFPTTIIYCHIIIRQYIIILPNQEKTQTKASASLSQLKEIQNVAKIREGGWEGFLDLICLKLLGSELVRGQKLRDAEF
jgi:hypothetical protein